MILPCLNKTVTSIHVWHGWLVGLNINVKCDNKGMIPCLLKKLFPNLFSLFYEIILSVLILHKSYYLLLNITLCKFTFTIIGTNCIFVLLVEKMGDTIALPWCASQSWTVAFSEHGYPTVYRWESTRLTMSPKELKWSSPPTNYPTTGWQH